MDIIKNNRKEKFALITFDDVSNTFYNVYPILQKYKIPFTLFIADKYAIAQDDFLTYDDLRKLSEDPLCTIGAHTLTHPILKQCNSSSQEISEIKTRLQNQLSKEIDYFAYPYGKPRVVSRRNRQEARCAGYKCAFSTVRANITPLTKFLNYYFIPRLTEV